MKIPFQKARAVAVRKVSWCLAGAFAVSLIGPGCQTPPPTQAERLSFTIKDVRRVAVQAREGAVRAAASLQTLADQPQGDLRPAFDHFSTQVKKLGGLERELARESREMQSGGAAYFTSWKKETQKAKTPEVRERSARRREQAMRNFQDLNSSLQAAVDVFTPFLKRLRDAEGLLSHDLNPQGAATQQELSASTAREVESVVATFSALIHELDRVAAEFAPVKTAAPPPL